MVVRKISVDSKSYELAEHFLSDAMAAGKAKSKDIDELAEAIQTTCEDFCRVFDERLL